jgi:hypothetical protein
MENSVAIPLASGVASSDFLLQPSMVRTAIRWQEDRSQLVVSVFPEEELDGGILAISRLYADRVVDHDGSGPHAILDGTEKRIAKQPQDTFTLEHDRIGFVAADPSFLAVELRVPFRGWLGLAAC